MYIYIYVCVCVYVSMYVHIYTGRPCASKMNRCTGPCASRYDIYMYLYVSIYTYMCVYIYTHIYIYLEKDRNTILTPKAGSPGHLWSYQTQHMCRRLANTHHTSFRTQITPHTSERGGGISCTRPTPARSISLTTRHFLLLVKCSRRVVCRLDSGTHRPLHTFERVAVA